MTFLLIHKPFVHEFIVGHTLNESVLLSKTLFKNKLLPVRYLPTMVITPNGPSKFFKKFFAYSVNLNLSP
jgi:hypothetical protein